MIKEFILNIPESLKIFREQNILYFVSYLGTSIQKLPKYINLLIIQNKLKISLQTIHKTLMPQLRLFQSIIKNKIIGLSQSFTKILILNGIGFKFLLVNNILTLYTGFTHTTMFNIPSNIQCIVETPTQLKLSCIDNEILGLFCTLIRYIKYPEPYKGKGILYQNEKIIQKVGKRGK